MQRIRIFTASPSDMAGERATVKTVAESLEPLASHLEIALDVADWNKVVPDMGRPEQVILDQLKPSSWDVFVGILWHRFGTPPGERDPETLKEYLGGTEEEFRVAYALWKQFRKPRILVYRCTRDIPQGALDPEQFTRVRTFFSQFDPVTGSHQGLYQTFDTAESFAQKLLGHLQQLLLDMGERMRGAPVSREIVQAFAPRVPDNLPRRAPFFGRAKELRVVLRALSPDDRTWGALIDGIGGIGKSALAVEAAYHCKDQRLFDAFILVTAKLDVLTSGGVRPLEPAARTLDEFLNETARVLGQVGICQLSGQSKRRALLDALRPVRTLLIYDNLETLTQEEQDEMSSFLRELPQGSKAIITSRRRGGEGGYWLRVEQLEWTAARDIIRNEMEHDARLRTKLEPVGEGHWPELHDETKGSPLALVHMLGLMRTRASLTFNGTLELLRGNRLPDLQAFIFQETRRELTSNDEVALRTLAYFASSASFEAWMAVSELTRNALETTIDRLSSLALVDAVAGLDRYTLHPLTRNFVRDEFLRDAATARNTGLQFAAYWLRQTVAVDEKAFESLELEWVNLDAAAEWLWKTAGIEGSAVSDREAARTLATLVGFLSPFTTSTAHWDDAIRLHSRAYEALRTIGDLETAVWHAREVSWVHVSRGEADLAEPWVDAYADAEGPAREDYFCSSLRDRGSIATIRGQFDAADRFFLEAIEFARRLNMSRNLFLALYEAANGAILSERHAAAEAHLLEAIEIAEKLKEGLLLSSVYSRMGVLQVERQQWDQAEAWLKRAEPFTTVIGRIAVIKYGLASVHEARGELEVARTMAREALAVYQRLRLRNEPKVRALVERLNKANESDVART